MLGSLPADEVDETWLALHHEKDKPIKFSDQIAMLEAAGFHAVDVIHKMMNCALCLAFK